MLLSAAERDVLTDEAVKNVVEFDIQKNMPKSCKVEIEDNRYVNLKYALLDQLQIQPLKSKVKKEIKQNNEPNPDLKDPKFYVHYIKPLLPEVEIPQARQKIKYEVSIHRAVFTDEIFDIYKRYELAVHKREVKPEDLKSHLCNSPVYDPLTEHDIAAQFPIYDSEKLDETWARDHADEGVFLRHRGSYHMYHRLDGKLVAFGNLDFLQEYANSGYFCYDPDYKFLNLGVVGALREIEYLRMVRSCLPERFKWYVLGDLVPQCPKVNYKL